MVVAEVFNSLGSLGGLKKTIWANDPDHATERAKVDLDWLVADQGDPTTGYRIRSVRPE